MCKGGGAKIVKNMIFWRKIVIFHTKYPKNVRASLRSAQFFQVRPPNLKSWIHPEMYISGGVSVSDVIENKYLNRKLKKKWGE